MDTFTINIPKGESLESEDYVGCRQVDNYTIIVQCDGNGQLGSMSKRHQLGEKTYSEIAITTAKYGQKMLMELDYIFRKPRTMLVDRTRAVINQMLKNQYDDPMNVYFCLLVCIIDKRHNKLYTFSIGDCGYMLVDHTNGKYLVNPQQCIYALKVSGDYIRIIPNSSKFNPYIEEAIFDLPKKYTLMVHSDGIGWDKVIPKNMIPDVMNMTDATVKDPDIIDKFNSIITPVIGNINEVDLCHILSTARKSMDTGYKIISEIYPLYKRDDVSFCIVSPM